MKYRFLAAFDGGVGLDIGTSQIKMVKLRQHGDQYACEKSVIVHLSDGIFEDGCLIKPDKLTALLKERVISSGLSGSQTVAAIGGRSLFLRELQLPDMPADELSRAMKWQLEKYIPQAAEEYVYGFLQASAPVEAGQTRFVLMAAPRQQVEILTAVLKDCCLEPIAIEVEALALGRMLSVGANCLVVDIGKLAGQIFVYQQSVPVLSRTIRICGQLFTEIVMQQTGLDQVQAERVKKTSSCLLAGPQGEQDAAISREMVVLLAELAIQIQQTVDFYRGQHAGAVVENVKLSGGGACLRGIAPALEQLVAMPVSVLESPLSIGRQDLLSAQAPQLAGAIGLGLYRSTQAGVNFLSSFKQGLFSSAKRILQAAAIAILTAFTVIYCYITFTIHQLNKNLYDVRTQSELLKPTETRMLRLAAKQRNIAAKQEVLLRLSQEGFSRSSLLAHIGTLTIDNVWLTEISHTDQQPLKLKGLALAYVDLAAFLKKIEQHDIMIDAALLDFQNLTTGEKEQQSGLCRFEITVKLKAL